MGRESHTATAQGTQDALLHQVTIHMLRRVVFMPEYHNAGVTPRRHIREALEISATI